MEKKKLGKNENDELEPFEISNPKGKEFLKKFCSNEPIFFSRPIKEYPDVEIIEPEDYDECVVIQDNQGEKLKIVKQEAEMLEWLRSKYQIKFFFIPSRTSTYLEEYKWVHGINLNQPRYSIAQMEKWATDHPHHLYSLQLLYPYDFRTDTARPPPYPLTELPPEFATGFKHLQKLSLDWIPLTSLQNIPPIRYLSFKDAHFSDLYSFPPIISRLKGLSFYSCRRLMSLAGLPRELPHLEHLGLWDSPIQTLDHLHHVPRLKEISCKNVQIRNFAGISELKSAGVGVVFDSYSFISLYRIPKPWSLSTTSPTWFDRIKNNIRDFPENFPASYLPKLDQSLHSKEEILEYFSVDPSVLAMNYINGEILSEFEQDRIVAEGRLETLHIMLHHLPRIDPLLKALADRWHYSHKLENSEVIL